MKKKFLFVFLALVMVLPVLFLTACSEPTKYTFSFKTSSEELGRVFCSKQTSEGTVSIAEGQQITLVATVNENTSADKKSSFAGWVYQNSILLTDSTSGYNIENTLNDDNKIIKSTLTFSSTNTRQGQYTAVFSGGNTQFVKLSSFYATTDIQSEPSTEILDAAALMTAQINVRHGTEILQDVLTTESETLYDNVLVTPENINTVLRLEPTELAHFRATASLTIADSLLPAKLLNADLTFGESTNEKTENNVTSQVVFSENTYKLIFSFSHNQQNYYLIFIYQPLA